MFMTNNGHKHNEAGRWHEEQQIDRRADVKIVYTVYYCTCGERMRSVKDREEPL